MLISVEIVTHIFLAERDELREEELLITDLDFAHVRLCALQITKQLKSDDRGHRERLDLLQRQPDRVLLSHFFISSS